MQVIINDESRLGLEKLFSRSTDKKDVSRLHVQPLVRGSRTYRLFPMLILSREIRRNLKFLTRLLS